MYLQAVCERGPDSLALGSDSRLTLFRQGAGADFRANNSGEDGG